MTIKVRLEVADLSKTFTMHLRGGLRIPVLRNISFAVAAGECVVLGGPSGVGKSTILKLVYGSYRADAGRILLHAEDRVWDVASADPRTVLRLRRAAIGYVSQFLQVVPRTSARDIVAEPLVALGTPRPTALSQSEKLLQRLNLPRTLWGLPPATFSGGEQQRVNIAHGFIAPKSLLLLDEPTASLDEDNKRVVIRLIQEAKQAGSAVLGIFHDEDVRAAVADRIVDVAAFSSRSAAA